MSVGPFEWIRARLRRLSGPTPHERFNRLIAEQASLVTSGATDADAVLAAFEREVATLRDRFTQAMWRYNFAQWLIAIGLHELVFPQLEASAALFAADPESPQGLAGLALVRVLQSKCRGLFDAPAALRDARLAVESVCRVRLGEAAPAPTLELVRSLHGSLGDDELLLGIVCARYATALLLQPSPEAAAVLEASRWLLLAIECVLSARDLPPLSTMAREECAEGLSHLGDLRGELGLDADELDALDEAEDRLFSDAAMEAVRRDGRARLEQVDPATFLQSAIRGAVSALTAEHARHAEALLQRLDRHADPLEFGGCALLLGEYRAEQGAAAEADELLATAWEVLGAALPPGHLWRWKALAARAELLQRSGDLEEAMNWTVAEIAELTLWGQPIQSLDMGVLPRLAELLSESNPSASVFYAKLSLVKAVEAFGPLRGIHPWLDELLEPGWGSVQDLSAALIRMGRLGETQEVLDWGIALSTARALSLRSEVRPLSPRLSFTPAERAQDAKLREVVCTLDCEFEPHLLRTREVVGSIAGAFAAAEGRYRGEVERLGETILARHLDRLPHSDIPTAVIRYVVRSGHVDVLLLSPSGSMNVTVPIAETELNQRAFDFLQLAGEPPQFADSWHDHLLDARQLYDRLLPPAVRERLEQDRVARLVIGASGPLRFVPFAALHDGTGYLVERFSLVRIPEVYVDLKAEPVWPRSLALLGAGSVEGHTALPGVARELDAIRRIIAPGGSRDVHVLDSRDAAFGVEVLKEALSGSSSVVHISSHFLATPADASRSYLLLGTGEALLLGDIDRLSGRLDEVDLLVLSACSTGLPAGRSDPVEWTSPASLFHARGVRSVLTTLWPVEDDAMTVLMKRWYAGMFEVGWDKAEALRQAQHAALYGDARRGPGHPYLWAGAELSGNWVAFRRADEQSRSGPGN